MIILALLLQSQTICRPVLGQVVCDTTRQAAPLDYQGIMDRAKASATITPLRRDPGAEVARRLRAGDCEGAKRAALDAGDVDLALKAAQLCEK